MDDGSTDCSGALLDAYAAKDARFKVIHQQNSGVSVARNVALKVASAQWISFLDADDLLTPNFLKVMVSGGSERADIKLVNYKEIRESHELNDAQPAKERICRQGEVVRSDEYFHPLYAGCYRRKTFSKLQFEPLCIGEDRVWYATALDEAKEVAHIEYVGYGYRLRRGSAVHSPMTPKKFIDDVIHLKNIVSILDASKNEYEKAIRRRIGQYVTEYTAKDFFWMPASDRELCKNVYFEVIRFASKSSRIPFFQRAVMWICSRSNSQLLTYILCFMPYKLKELGVHR